MLFTGRARGVGYQPTSEYLIDPNLAVGTLKGLADFRENRATIRMAGSSPSSRRRHRWIRSSQGVRHHETTWCAWHGYSLHRHRPDER